ncbi:MAG: dephospho-CoA kinase [Elusimicrobia bacterium]|nr:dephospho-CoA kinase [Elusimicrobiota bacterium]
MKTKKNYLIIGLTGGIASGKSTAVKIFGRLGAKIIDSDKISRDIVKPKSKIWKKIIKCLGPDVLGKNKTINRKKLGHLVFNNPSKRRVLEKITHPEIIRQITKRIEKIKDSGNNSIIIVDAPLLFEAKLDKITDKTIVVWCPRKCQVQRLKARNKLNNTEINNRLRSQIPLNRKKRMADFVIDNSGKNKKMIQKQIRILWENLSNRI